MSSKSRLNVEFARTEAGVRLAADQALQSELDITQAGTGLNSDGTYSADQTTNYLTGVLSLKAADKALDATVKTLRDDFNALGAGSLTAMQEEIDRIETGAGLNNDGTYSADNTSNYLDFATSLKNADMLLDAQVKVNETAISTEATARIAADSALQLELDATQVGTGLTTGGAYSADTGANYINLATSVHNATQRLDTALKSENTNRISAVAGLQTELDATQAGAGLNIDGTYTANGAANYIQAATSLKNADNLLDARIKLVADDLANLGSGSLVALQAELDATQAGAGLDVDGSYIANATANYIATATDLADADDKLDTQVKANNTAITNEVANRITAVGAEATARAAQDDVIEAGAGLEADGTYLANPTTNYLATATSLKNADERLDIQVKANEVAIAAETADRVTAVGTVTTNLATEVTNRTNADAAIQAELDATQLGAGLNTDGTYTANATSNYITGALSLQNADNLLDARAKTNADAIATLQGLVSGSTGDIQVELDATQLGAGLNADGTYTANGDANYIAAATSLQNADNLLDGALKAEETARSSADASHQAEIDATQLGAGLNATGTYTADPTTNFITTATSLKNADFLLDAELELRSLKDDEQDLALAARLPLAGGTMVGNINMDGNYITGLPTPVNSGDATNKGYVDGKLAGLSWKNAVKAATTENVDLAIGGLLIVDDYQLAEGDRVLVMNQTDPAWNGIYDASAGAWIRSEDFDELAPIDEINGAAVYVENGTLYGDAGFTVSSNVETKYTDPIIFTQFNGASGITAGTGMSKIGNTLYLNLGAGIGELPTDEIGVEVYTAGGLFNTLDGTTESSHTDAQLSVKLNGTTLALSATGLKVSNAVINEITTNTNNIALEVTNRTNADAAIQSELDATQLGAGLTTTGTYSVLAGSNYLTAATSIHNATSLLDGRAKTNADAIATLQGLVSGSTGDIQAELDATQVGAGLDVDGSYIVNATANYIATATDLADADDKLDVALKAVSDVANAAEPDLGVGIDNGYVLMTNMDGTRSWVPFNQTQVGQIHQVFTATAGQSVFTLNYNPDVIDVYLNGFKLIKGTDFTASNGTSVTVSPALTAGDILEVVSYEQYIYANVPQLDVNGDLWINGDVHATAFYTDSLRELKTDIVSTSINAVDLINSTEIVEFKYKSNLEGDTRIGFIADDTDAVFSSSSKNQFDLANTVGVLMKAVQELSAKNAELEARLAQLEK